MPNAILWRERGIKTGPEKPKDPDPTKPTGIQVPDGAVLFGYNSRYDSTAAGSYLYNTSIGTPTVQLKNIYRKYEEILNPLYAGGGVYLKTGAYKPGDGTIYGVQSIFLTGLEDSNSYNISTYLGQINIASTGLSALQSPYNYTEITSGNAVTSQKYPPVYKVVLDARAGLTNQAAILQDWDYNRGSGKHGYLSPHPLGQYDFDNPARLTTDIPKILGAAPGDTLSTTEKYTLHNKAHEGHTHEIIGSQISDALARINFGGVAQDSTGNYTFTTGGLNLLPVIPLVKDSRLGVATTTLITSLPKGVLVLGNDLAASDPDISLFVRDQYDPTAVPTTEDYTMHDYDHESNISTIGDSASSDNSQMYDNLNTYNGVPLFLVTRSTDVGVLSNGGIDTFKVYASSNTGGLHSHASTTTAFKSTKTGQTGAVLGDSGAHNHQLSISGNFYPRAKWLNGYITLKDETPLANGMIIGYSYQGDTSRFKGTTTEINDIIPQYWHFCDGTNGTPDLRGYAIAVNMYESNMGIFDSEVNGASYLSIDAMNVQPSSGENSMLYSDKIFKNYPIKTHTHVTGYETGTGTPISMKGSHDLNPARWHVHELVGGATIAQQIPTTVDKTKNTTTYTNFTFNLVQTDTAYAWNPSKSNIAFIMLNKALP